MECISGKSTVFLSSSETLLAHLGECELKVCMMTESLVGGSGSDPWRDD